ncbi:MAG TPA: hypothetical protein VKP60_02705 [Magnetospirillaceae bacterium]|nr:hypothetical protein [Magnetospirillaceae bacterium]
MEYSSQNQQLNFPNPLKLHNRFLYAAAAIVFAFGGALLISVRDALQAGLHPQSYLAIGLAVAMIAAAVALLYRALSQIRFYFGRGRPQGLAPALKPEGHGSSPQAEHVIKETLRQQAIEYAEPKGPITGLLYGLIPNLLYAPRPLRAYAEWQFKGVVTLTVLLLGIIGALTIGMPVNAGRHSSLPEWIGLLFVLAALWTLVRPGSAPTERAPDGALLSVQWMSWLIAFAFVGPIAISVAAPRLPPVPLAVSPYPHVFVFLLAGILVHALFFAAIIRQLLPPPPTAVSMIQETWNLSTNPAMVTGEFLRALQEAWREKIPNRRYARIEPAIDLGARTGSFAGEIIEETQPFPRKVTLDSEQQISPSGTPVLVLALDGAGLAFIAIAAVMTFLVGRTIGTAGGIDATLGLYAILCWALGAYAIAAASRLWLRFDFESRLFWLEMSGQYVSGQVEQGNVIQGNLRASSSMVQVEGMTFRLWCADIHTVCFGKDAPRHIVALAGNPDAAEGLAARLKGFATSQASVAALGNAANAERLAINNALANRARQPDATPLPPGAAGVIATPDPEGQ